MKSEAKSLKIQPVDSSKSSPSGLTSDDLSVLKAPIPKERVGVKVQSLNKDRTRALLVLYLQHTDVQDRLDEVDPGWTTEVLKEDKVGDTTYVRLRLTVKGVSRENVGEGGDPKGAYSDALKRCAMLFGVGRYLYDSPTVWVDYNESRDRYRQWSVEDYERSIPGERIQTEPTSTTSSAPVSAQPRAKPAPRITPATEEGKKPVRPREQLNRILMNLYRPYLIRFPDTKFVEVLNSRYGVGETRLMTVEQMEDLVQYMEEQLKAAA